MVQLLALEVPNQGVSERGGEPKFLFPQPVPCFRCKSQAWRSCGQVVSAAEPRMAETTDLLQLRKLNLELLRKLTAGQETMRRLVAKVQAASGVGATWGAPGTLEGGRG